jgi:hypothetical protein
MSHEIDELYEVYSETKRKARKPHICDACGEPIRVSQHLWYVFIIFDEQVEHLKRCERCQAIHVHLRGLGDEMWPDERLACGEEYREHWGFEPPPEIAALAFAPPGEKTCTT